jgi:uncharacterized membrane protein
MFQANNSWSDEQVEQMVGDLLRVGVLLATVVVLIGGILYLVHDGMRPGDWRFFHGEPADLRSPTGIVQDAWAGSARGLIQLGLLVLIATPVARVAFSLIAFGRQRDWTYVVITGIVLAVLLGSLIFGHPEGRH